MSEHAPVQAIYIGAKIGAADPGAPVEADYVVHHGQLLFVDTTKQTNEPTVFNKANGVASCVPFGIAHDAVLDGKLAMHNPESVAVVSVIVSGCVTMLAAVTDAKVGGVLCCHPSGSGETYDMGNATYQGPLYAMQAPGNPVRDAHYRIGTIVEVYPGRAGVLRVLLDIQVDPTASVGDLEAGRSATDVTMAPQHPVYAPLVNRTNLWEEGRPVFQTAEAHTTTFPADGSDMFMAGLAADTAAYIPDQPDTNVVATQVAGAGSCTLTRKDRAHFNIGTVVSRVHKTGAGELDKHATMRILARPGRHEYYVLLSTRTGLTEPHVPGAIALAAAPAAQGTVTITQASFAPAASTPPLAAPPTKKAKTAKGKVMKR